ncbi:MAG: ornithine carbamoyltransferase [Alphaproteobacteria bacterium]|nr:ornithine carbamoyltransferase [Alphaproteobacteria bacterium]
MVEHFLDILPLGKDGARALLSRAAALKQQKTSTKHQNRALVCIFEKPSTRTRVSFERAAHQLGAQAIVLRSDEMQLGRGETIADTARVLSRYGDAVMLRTTAHARLLELATFSSIPIINGLTDKSHPCQILADLLTCVEAGLDLETMQVAWIGDINNVTRSWIEAAQLFGFRLTLGTPLAGAGLPPQIGVTPDIMLAVRDADVVVTDTWVSMGCTDVAGQKQLLAPYQVNEAVMDAAKPSAIFLHCLPAVRGEEVTDGVIDGVHSRVWDEAENRLHAQKAILDWLWR